MKWTQIKTVCNPADTDSVCAVMSILDTHLMIEDTSDITEYNHLYGELIDEELLDAGDEASVSLFVSEARSAAEYQDFITERLNALGIGHKIEIIETDEEEWADNWKRYYKPVKIGKLVVVPEWETYSTDDPEEIIIVMDPGMAFGTGTHESTRLCALLLERHLNPGCRMLDIGTGSGILAIAASKLGASGVSAYDIDPIAVRIARENVKKNDCRNISCDVSDLFSAVNGLYDFAVANITAEIVMRLAKSAGNYIRRGGMLALSGIIDKQCDEVKAALSAENFCLRDELHDNGWSGLLFVNRGIF